MIAGFVSNFRYVFLKKTTNKEKSVARQLTFLFQKISKSSHRCHSSLWMLTFCERR